MKVSQLKEQIRGIIRERSVKAIQKDYSNVVSDMEKHLELYKKSKGTPAEKKHIGHLKDLTAKKKKLQAELDLAVSNLYKNAELKVDEAITNPKKTNPSDLAKTVLGWFDFYTDYIDDGGQRRRAIKSNDDVLVWFGSHPKDVKEKAYKIMLSQAKGEKGQVERTFGKHLNESVNEETSFNKNISDIESAFKTIYGDKVKDVKFIKTSGLKDGLVKVDFDIPARDLKKYGIGNSNPYLNKIEKLLSKKFKQDVFLNAFTVGNGSITYDLIGESVKESTKRDYKAEYKKFQSSTESKKYRAELNKYNRDKGTYGNGDGKDASHKNGKIVGFEDESVNRGRAEKSRLKKESLIKEDIKKDIDKFIDKLNKQFPDQEYTISSGGGKYVRINHKNRKFGGGESAWGFISLVDNPTKGFKKGDLLKAAGYNTPAKHARGNILNGDAKYDKYSPTYLKEEVNEATEPQVISQLRDIVKKKQYQDVKDPSSGKKMKVDMQTANTVLKIYDGLSNVNKQNMAKMSLPKMIDVSYKIVGKYK
jgi:hypothetical protein